MALVSVNKDGLSPNDEIFNRLIRSSFKEYNIESFHPFLTETCTLITDSFWCTRIWRRQYGKGKEIINND